MWLMLGMDLLFLIFLAVLVVGYNGPGSRFWIFYKVLLNTVWRNGSRINYMILFVYCDKGCFSTVHNDSITTFVKF